MNIRENHSAWLSVLACLGFVLGIGGCGAGKEKGPKIYPVSGKVMIDGKPAAYAQITFHPSATGSTASFAVTDDDGSFRPTTRLTGDGVPAGDYAVTIVWPAIIFDHGEPVAGRDRLGGRYRSPGESTLKVTIKEGENSLLPFELKSAP